MIWPVPEDIYIMGACADEDHEMFFDPAQYTAAKAVCRECPVKVECLDYAMEAHEPYGIWGGTSPEQRRKMRSRKDF